MAEETPEPLQVPHSTAFRAYMRALLFRVTPYADRVPDDYLLQVAATSGDLNDAQPFATWCRAMNYEAVPDEEMAVQQKSGERVPVLTEDQVPAGKAVRSMKRNPSDDEVAQHNESAVAMLQLFPGSALELKKVGKRKKKVAAVAPGLSTPEKNHDVPHAIGILTPEVKAV